MPTDKSIIEAYNKHAKAYAKRQRDDTNIYRVYLERPAIFGNLPNLHGKDVLCLGCGSGEEFGCIKSLGAKKIIGIDISKKLIAIAKKDYPEFDSRVMNAENLDFPKESFDLVFSSLTMHYLEGWLPTLKSVNKVLRQDGIFIFSMTHPFFSAIQKKEDERIKSRIFGYKDFKNTADIEIYGDYLNSYRLDAFVSKELTVSNYHRPFSIIIKEFIESGFELIDLVEPKAQDESKDKYYKFWAIHQKIPEFIVFKLKKRRQ